eukprot:gene2977-3164_t
MRPLIQTLLLLQAIFVHSKVLNIEQENFNRVKNDLGFHGETDVLNGEEEPEFTFFPTSVPSTLQIQVPAIVVELVSRDLLVERFVGSSGSPAPPIATVNAVWGDSIGSIYASSERYIYKILSGGDIVSVFAGNGGSSIVDGVPAIESGIDSVTGLAGDSNGNIFLVDQGANIIRKIDALTAIVNTIAGSTYHYGLATNYAPALSTYLSSPSKLWIATDNSIYFTNSGVNQVLKLVYDYNMGSYLIEIVYEQEIEQEGGEAPLALQSNLQHLVGITGDNQGNIFLSDKDGGFIYMLSTEGSLNAIIGGGTEGTSLNPINAFSVKLIDPNSLFFHPNGNLYCSERNQLREFNFTTNDVVVISGRNTSGFNGEVVDSQTVLFNDISDFWVDKDGTFFIADTNNGRIRHLQAGNGFVSTFFAFLNGDGGYVQDAHVGNPLNLWGDSFGNLYYVERNFCAVKKVNVMMNTVTTFGGTSSCTSGSFDGFPFKFTSLSPFLTAIWGAENGDYYFVDEGMMKVSKADKGGAITTLDENCLITTLVGTGFPPGDINIEAATQTPIYAPLSVWIDTLHQIYFIDSQNSIQKVSILPEEPTIAPTAATSDLPYVPIIGQVYQYVPPDYSISTVWVDSLGGIYTDASSFMIRHISNDHEWVETIGGNPFPDTYEFEENRFANETYIAYLTKMWGDSVGNLYYVDRGKSFLVQIDAISRRVSSIGPVNKPNYVWGNTAGHLFVSESTDRWSTSCVRRISSSNMNNSNGTFLICDLMSPTGVWGDTEGLVYVISEGDGRMWRFNETIQQQVIGWSRSINPTDDDHSVGESIGFGGSNGLWVDSHGTIFITLSQSVVKYDPNTDEVRTVAGGSYNYPANFGDEGPATGASFSNAEDVWGDSIGNIFIADKYHCRIHQSNCVIRIVDVEGTINTIGGVWSCIPVASPLPQNGILFNASYLSNYASGFWIDDGNNYYYIDQRAIKRVSALNQTVSTVAVNVVGLWEIAGGLIGDNRGNFFISVPDLNIIQKVDVTGVLTRFAGVFESSGYNGDGIPALEASLYHPVGLWLSSLNELFFADQYNHRIRKIDELGNVSTIAGTGFSSFNGDEGLATGIDLSSPTQVFGDDIGNLFIADYNNFKVRMLTRKGNTPNYYLRTVIGATNGYYPNYWDSPFGYPTNIWISNANHTLYVAFQRNGYTSIVMNEYLSQLSDDITPEPTTSPLSIVSRRKLKVNRLNLFNKLDLQDFDPLEVQSSITPTSYPSTFPTLHRLVSFSMNVFAGASYYVSSSYTVSTLWGNTNGVLYSDASLKLIREVSPSGHSKKFAGVEGGSLPLEGFLDGSNARETYIGQISKIWGDTIGNLFYSDLYLNLIVEISAGTKLVRGVASVNAPIMMWGNTLGQLFVTEGGETNCVRKIDLIQTHSSMMFLCGQNYPSGIGGDTVGSIYFIANGPGRLIRSQAPNEMDILIGPPLGEEDEELNQLARFGKLWDADGIWVDSLGSIYYSSRYYQQIIHYDPLTGFILPFAGTSSRGSGGSATNVYIRQPSGVWGDKQGNLFYVDRGYCVIRKVDRSGTIINIAGTWNCGYGDDGRPANATQISDWSFGFWGDEEGNYYYLDNRNLRKIESGFNNVVTTLYYSVTNDKDAINLQDQQAQYELFLTGDNDGNLFVVIPYQHVIKQYDISGNGFKGLFAGMFQQGGYNGDGPFPTEATLNYPASMWIDGDHNVFIADQWNHRIRMVDGASGYIRTIAGTGNSGYNGDKMEATNAWLNNPCSITGDGEGTLFVVDRDNQRVRILTPSIGADNVLSYTIDTALGNDGNSNWYLDKPLSVWMRDVNHLLLLQRRYGYYMITETHPDIAFPSDSPVTTPYSNNEARRLSDSYPTNRPTQFADAPVYSIPVSQPYYAPYLTNYYPSPHESSTTSYPAPVSRPSNRPTQVPTFYNLGEVTLLTQFFVSSWEFSGQSYEIATIWGNSIGEIFSDADGRFIRKITNFGQSVNLVAGCEVCPFADYHDGNFAISTKLYGITKIWGDTLGNLFIVDQVANMIIQVLSAERTVWKVGNIDSPSMMWGNTLGQLFISEKSNHYENGRRSNCILQFSLNSSSQYDSSDYFCGFQYPTGVWGDSSGAIYTISQWDGRLMKLNDQQSIEVVVGLPSGKDDDDLKPSLTANIQSCHGMWGDSNGAMFMASWTHQIRQYDSNLREVTNVAGNGNSWGDLGDGKLATEASLSSPTDVWGDTNGNLFIADSYHYRVRKVDTAGIIQTVVDYQGGDFGPASLAYLGSPVSLRGDSNGNIYVVDQSYCIIRKVNTVGIITTIGGAWSCGSQGITGKVLNGNQLSYSVAGLTLDTAGNFYFLELDAIKIARASDNYNVSTICSGITKGGFEEGNGQWVNPSVLSLLRDDGGNFFVLVPDQHVIKLYRSDCEVQIVAGVYAVVGDAYGNLFIADRDNNRVRWLKPYENEDGYFITSILGNPSVYNSGNNPPLGARRLQEVSQLPLGMPFDLWADKNRSVLYILRNLWGYNTVVSVQLADGSPTVVPSIHPTLALSLNPTTVPSSVPTSSPSVYPTVALSAVDPTAFPSSDFGSIPSDEPTSLTRSPSLIPNIETTHQPTLEPTEKLTEYFSVNPTCLPTSMIPTTDPSVNPTHLPSLTPSNNPTFIPTLAPSLLKTQSPTAVPSCAPSGAPVVPLTPALIVNTVITVSNSSITTQILLSNDGIVSGGVFVVHAIAPSISQIVSQNINCVSQNKKCTVTFRSLIAATEYNVYFYTKSVDGVAMSADQVLQTKQAATTACCKPISISLSTSRLVEGQSYANLISASVTSLPKTSLSLTLWLGQDLSPRTIQNALVPSQIAFAATSSSSYRIGLSSQMMGRYYLGVSLTGVEASSYQVVFEGLSSVSSENAIYVASFPVLPSNASLPAPMLSRASFSNDGASVIVELDSTSNLAGMTVGTTFACNQLFDFLCVASAKCQWVDGKTIYASVPTSSSCALNVGNYIKFSSSAIIKAPCTSAASCVNYDRWPSSNTTKTVMLSTASSPVTPSVVLSIPKSIGACSPLSIDLTSSSGNGGRAWKSISITVASSSSNSTLLNQLRSFLSTIKTVNPPTVVAARYFTAGDQYSFTARLCNFLDQCGQTAQTLTIVSNTIPLISIAGASIVTLTRSQPLSLITNTQLSSCSGTASAGLTGLSYSWSVAVINDGNSFTKLSGLVSTSKDPSRFLLPAFSLTAGLSYQITVNVTYIPSGTFSIASAQLVVPQGKVKAVIAGSSQQNVRVKESLILDASRSYDEDVANSFGTAAGLQYQWSCVQTEPVLNNSCAAIFDMAKWTASITTGSMLISTLSSASNTKAQVTVLIVDKTNTRSSSVTIVVSVLPALLPTISLTASSSQINAGQTLQITGTVNYPASIEGNATWQILSGESGRNLSSLASTGLTQQFLRSSSAQSYSMYLVIPPNRLTIGTTYTFGLLAFSSYRGMSTLGSISVKVNAPPVLGSFSISPTFGKQLLQRSNNSAVNSFISKSLNPSKWTSVDDILQGTAIASYLLNQANCSLPSNYCTSRNRKPCATTSLTCGPCLSSAFVGTAGDSNDHCYSLEELKARAQVNNTLPLSTKSKECAGNCSSHGVCAYTSVKSGAVIGQCYEGDLSCSASCICSPGYTLSNNCELSDAEVEQKRNLREQVIAGIQQYVSLQDANEQSVSSWIDSMNDATQNPNELSEHSVSTVLDVANYAIKVATENGFDSSSLSSIVTSLDALASAVALKERRRRLTSGSSSNNGGIGGVELMQTLSNYSQLIGQQMLPGQEATSAVQSNFRFVVQSVASTSSISSGRRMLSSSAACASNISITLPQSSLEQFVGTEESAIRLPTCPEDQTSALSISVVSLSSTLYDAALFKSDPVSLHLSSTPCTDPENCNAEIVLQSDNLGRGVTLEASNVTYKCEAGDQAKHEVSCPGGKKYEITCDGKGSTVVATCPAERAVPTCNGLFGSATSDIGCKVVASSDTTTTCSCPIVVFSVESERRSLQFAHGNSSIPTISITVSYVGMLGRIADTFQTTVLSAADLNASTVAKSWMALVTVGSLVVGFVLALIVSHYADAKAKNKNNLSEKISDNISILKAHKRTTVQQLGGTDQKRSRHGKVNVIGPQLLEVV